MWLITTLVLVCGGLLGAANLIVAKRPNAKELIDKILPYQGGIGVVMFLWGLWDLIHLVRSVGILSSYPMWWLVFLVTTATQLGLGFFLGYGLISRYALSRNAQMNEKGEKLRAKLAVYQGPLGVVAIVLALFFILMNLSAGSQAALQ